jgi:hypothetical protein
MRKNGDVREADFCKLIRRWYAADDEAGLDCKERHKQHLQMRSWLLENYRPHEFPPPTGYVKGIPVVTFEALITNIERKIQLYSCVRAYNPRSISTLASENFFSMLGEFAPGGNQGLSIRPPDIPRAMAVAADLAKLHTDPTR